MSCWELKIDLLCKMCKTGAIMLTPLHEGDYKTQTYLLMTPRLLASNLRLESWRPLGLCTNRKGVTFLNSWHLRCYLFAHLKQKQKQKVLKINKYPGASSIRACSGGVVRGLHPLQLWVPHSRAALTSSPWQQRKQISSGILKSRPGPLNLT